jgi:phosphoribosyl-ATP pyrophosphohydrolase
LSEGVERCAKKFGEEAVEAVIAAMSADKRAIAAEAADVLYHLAILLAATDVTPDDVYTVLKGREGQSGLAEKASRPR